MSVRAVVAVAGKAEMAMSAEAAVRALAADEDAKIWIDLSGPISAELKQLLSRELGVHLLVLEDLEASYMVPKLEEFPEYTYLLVHGARRGERQDDLDFEEIDLVIGRRWIVSHQVGGSRIALDDRDLRALARGPAAAAHAVLDRVVDEYLPVVDGLEAVLDELEAEVMRDPSPEVLARVFAAKRAVFQLRRVAAYQRDLLVRLARPGGPVIPDSALPFFRDVGDHLTMVLFQTEAQREIATGIVERHLAMQSNRLNEVMKTLTMFSTVMLPLTLIAGIYGMNFENMPELKWRHGYPLALLAMGLVAVGLLFYFRRKRWL
ncbi:MAG: magnesium/cobalt transporter CorA [Polyangiaceae bacterium]|nr:magnesium/cobalt transporter CorA [Polyangiaceae bacterium]